MGNCKLSAGSEKLRKASFKRGLFLTALLLFIAWKMLAYEGFCQTDLKFLSEQQIVERYLMGSGWREMTAAQREAKIASIDNYPECCRLYNKPIYLSHADIFFNVLIWHRRLYGIETHFPRDAQNKIDGYYETYSDVDACGEERGLDTIGMSEGESVYLSALSRIAKYWQETGHSKLKEQRQHH